MSRHLNPPAGAAPRHVRKRLFIDSGVQRGLLVALVTLEVLLAGAAVWLIRSRLSGAIEETLYRVHVAHAEPLLARLSHEAWMVGGLFLAVNLAALLIAEGIWRSHVNDVLRALASYARAVAALDFVSHIDETRQHEALRLAAAWRNRERNRLRGIRDGARRLEAQVSRADVNADGVQEALRELAGLLPHPAGQPVPPAREPGPTHDAR